MLTSRNYAAIHFPAVRFNRHWRIFGLSACIDNAAIRDSKIDQKIASIHIGSWFAAA
jgi:hypothetical protein